MTQVFPAVNYGTCWSCVTDLTMPSQQASGFIAVGQAIARRWQTPRGLLIDDPNYGYPVSDYINDDIGQDDLARISQSLTAEAKKDERVLGCTVRLLFANGALTIDARVTTNAGPFRLVVKVSSVTAELLQVAPL